LERRFRFGEVGAEQPERLVGVGERLQRRQPFREPSRRDHKAIVHAGSLYLRAAADARLSD
jgi:hypothetical protein